MRYIGWLLCLIVLGSSFVSSVNAQPMTPGNEFTKGIQAAKNLATGTGLSDKTDLIPIITNVILWLLALSAVLAMGAIVWGGIMYISSLGDEGRAGKAKQIIFYAVIGVIVVLLSFVIISFVQTLLTAMPSIPPDTLLARVLIRPAEAAGICDESVGAGDSGFMEGINIICSKINPEASGLATDTDIADVIVRVVNILLALVAVLALAAMVWGSIMYILSLGDESRAEKAKKIILYAIIGVLLSGLSFLILNVVKGIIAP